MDLRQPYLTEQIIAYIGNKRALLPFLHDELAAVSGGRAGITFSDPFAGSGAVSRLARLMGFFVLANDWERYSYVINSCYLGVNASELPSLFRDRGGFSAVLAELESLAEPLPEKLYIARHFAPRSTAGADWKTERLFYTRENALAIDALRGKIEEMYPGLPADPVQFKEKMVLLGPLLYEASTHTNTSGVFKACHRGFGGHGGDALKRIMAPIKVRPPVLVDCPYPSRVFCQDAEAFAASHPADICYLDPPYASHQYGSNYFMLTTIALWDKPEVSAERGDDGRLREKAGIRKDWVTTRSAFCSRATAAEALRRIASAADCRHLLVSYSDEGIVSPEELADILASTGSLAVRSTRYQRFPGGKRSIGQSERSVELLFVVDRGGRSGGGRREVEVLMLQARLGKLLHASFHPLRLRKAFRLSGGALLFTASSGREIRLPMRRYYIFEDPEDALRSIPPVDAGPFMSALLSCRLADRREEIEVLMGLAGKGGEECWQREILRHLRGFAHRKFSAEFFRALGSVKEFAASRPMNAAFVRGIAAVEATAAKRFDTARTAPLSRKPEERPRRMRLSGQRKSG